MSITAMSVRQSYTAPYEMLQVMETFRKMVNDCIKIGLQNDTSTIKKLCLLSYHDLSRYDILTYVQYHKQQGFFRIEKSRTA